MIVVKNEREKKKVVMYLLYVFERDLEIKPETWKILFFCKRQ